MNVTTALFIMGCRHDVSWVSKIAPEDPPAVYVAGCLGKSFERVGCKDEAYSYLTFIVKHYDNLPARIVFLHGHRGGTEPGGDHYRWPADRMVALLMNKHSNYFFRSEFGGIYCGTNDHMAAFKFCKFQWIDQTLCEEDFLWNTMFAHTGIAKPSTWWYPRSGTFFVTRESIRRHPKRLYETLLENMKNLEYEILREYRICGRVFESAWATLFLSPNTSYVEPPYCKSQDCPLSPCPEALFVYHPVLLNNRAWFATPPLALLAYVLWVCGCCSRAWRKLKDAC